MAASQAPGEGSGIGPLGCGRNYLPPVTAVEKRKKRKRNPECDRNEEWELVTD